MKNLLYMYLFIGSLYSLHALQAVSKKDSNVRENPSLTSKVVGLLKKDVQVDILDKVTTKGRPWCKISDGYVSCKLLKIDKQIVIPNKIQKPQEPQIILNNTTKVDNKIQKIKTPEIIIKDTTKIDKFNDARKLFLNKEYKVAYDSFYTIFLNNLRDPNVNFYLGQSAFMLGRFDEAISAYERILFIDEGATRVKLELARCYMASGAYELAKVIFLETLKQDIPKNVRENINRYLNILDEKDIKNSFSGVAMFGFGWDDNVESLSTNYISEVTDAVFVSTNSLKSAWIHQEMVALNHIYKYSDTINFKNDGLFFMKNNMGFSQRNIQFIQYTPALSVIYSNQLSVDYALLYNHVWLDTSSLITNYAINPKLKFIYSKSLILGGSLKYQQKLNDVSTNKNRDAAYYDLTLNAQMIHTQKLSTLTQVIAASERKKRGTLTDVDYDLYNLATSIIYKSTDKLSLSLKAKLFHKSYVDNYIPTKERRKDDEYQGYLSATYMLSKKYILQAEYVYTDHQSNYNDFEFKKNSFTINFISIF